MKMSARDMAILAMMGALMFVTTFMAKILPNIHLLAPIIIATTRVYRGKALFPIYTYVVLEGVLQGFSLWWLPYLYVWAALWGLVMLMPKEMPLKAQLPLYSLAGALHGFTFGILWAPMQALLFGLSFKATITWIVMGLPYDLIHGVSNLVVCLVLVVPIEKLLRRLNRGSLPA